jgi:tetratricopeptide (TPR) repeat protein
VQAHQEDLPETQLARLEQALQRVGLPVAEGLPLLAALLALPNPAGAPPLSLSPERQKQQTQAVLLAWLRAEAEQQPVLAVWEDLHWADPSTLEWLGLLLDQVPTMRLLTLVTCRPEFVPPWASRAALAQLTLSRLMRPQAEAMVRGVPGGQALAAQGQYAEGLAQMHQGLATKRAEGSEIGRPGELANTAEACGRSGQPEAGLPLLDEALSWLDTHGEDRTTSGVYRIQGELLLRQAIPDAPQAEACFQYALAVAHRQQAKSYELRAALSLARLWQQQGKRGEARALLAPIYHWFTEGFDTADLQDAKVLLDELT